MNWLQLPSSIPESERSAALQSVVTQDTIHSVLMFTKVTNELFTTWGCPRSANNPDCVNLTGVRTVALQVLNLTVSGGSAMSFTLMKDLPFNVLVWILNSISVHLINGRTNYLTICCQICHFHSEHKAPNPDFSY